MSGDISVPPFGWTTDERRASNFEAARKAAQAHAEALRVEKEAREKEERELEAAAGDAETGNGDGNGNGNSSGATDHGKGKGGGVGNGAKKVGRKRSAAGLISLRVDSLKQLESGVGLKQLEPPPPMLRGSLLAAAAGLAMAMASGGGGGGGDDDGGGGGGEGDAAPVDEEAPQEQVESPPPGGADSTDAMTELAVIGALAADGGEGSPTVPKGCTSEGMGYRRVWPSQEDDHPSGKVAAPARPPMLNDTVKALAADVARARQFVGYLINPFQTQYYYWCASSSPSPPNAHRAGWQRWPPQWMAPRRTRLPAVRMRSAASAGRVLQCCAHLGEKKKKRASSCRLLPLWPQHSARCWAG